MTSVERLVTNGQRILQVLKDFSFNSSGDVSIDYIINNDGDEETYTMWSVRKIMDNLKGVVSDVMWESVYVDAVDGDDSNLGTESSPLKTIYTAIKSNSNMGLVYVKLKRGQLHKLNRSDDYEVITCDGQTVILEDYGNDTDDIPQLTSDAFILDTDDTHTSILTRIELYQNGSLFINNIEVVYPDIIDDKPFNTFSYQSMMFLSNGGTSISALNVKCDFTNSVGASLFNQSRYRKLCSFSLEGCNITYDDDTYIINNRSYSPISLHVNNQTNTNGGEDNYIRNIIRDADSGNPVNINSNVNFSS